MKKINSFKKPIVSTKLFYKRMLLIGFTSTICIALIIFPMLYAQLNRYVKNNIIQYEEHKTHKISAQLEDYFSQTVNSAACIENMITVPSYELKEESDYWHNMLLKANIGSYVTSMQFIAGISLKEYNNIITAGNPENAEEYNKCIGHYRNCTIYVAQDITWPSNLRFSYENKSTQKAVDIYLKSSYITNLLFDENTYLINGDGAIIMSLDSTVLGNSIYDIYNLKKDSNEKPTTNSDYFISTEKISTTDAYLISVTPKSNYRNQFMDIIFTSLILILPITALGTILVILLIKKISKPILDISNTMKYYLPYDEENFESEIMYINDSIIKAMESNKRMREELPKVIQLSKRSQAQAVYSQINPHFIFNTLDNLKWQSVLELGVGNNIEKICVLLQKIIYECLQQHDMISTVNKEIEITNNYILLMQLRYENCFSVNWNVEEDLKNALVIKLTLQPLIENSIMHSFQSNISGQRINIDISKESEDAIIISVSDNGIGMDKECLEEILASLNDGEQAKKHIGIKNIHLRYQLLYGNEYGIASIESNCKGTTVKVRIPYHKTI